jgi:thiamine kinase-like enzyme
MRYLIEAITATYQRDAETHEAFGWIVERKAPGMNGLVYKAQSENAEQLPLAVKISLRDERQRTLREFSAMQALLLLDLRGKAPIPLQIFNDPAGLPGDVLVMEWLSGDTLQAPPAPDDKMLWRAILLNFVDVHSVRPTPRLKLFPAMMNIIHPKDLLAVLHHRRSKLPQTGNFGAFTASELDAMLDTVAKRVPPQWNTEPLHSLILCDANPTNMIVDRGHVRFVDWANSGWSDGAFDIADMLAQPSYTHLPPEHRNWIRETYAEMVGDSHAVERIQVLERMMYVFWACITTQTLVGAAPPRLSGAKEYPLTQYANQQKHYWECANTVFG